MKIPLNGVAVILAVTITAVFGLLLGGLFGYTAGNVSPVFFIEFSFARCIQTVR